MNKNIDRIQLLGLEIIALISSGKKEKIVDIEKHMGEGDMVSYLLNKYGDEFSNSFDEIICDFKAWNDEFMSYYGYVQGNENRKWGIINENDGLLLVVALIMSIMTEK